jgi:mRNA-degrading endonuclease YafQ of YafQ-DinJ toxin-antitoxin module
VGAIETALAEESEVSVTVHGQLKYVVMSREQYAYLRECELEAALAESNTDIAAGRFVKESVDAHIARLKTVAWMPWELVFTDQYNRRAARFLRKHPDVVGQYTKTLKLLEANPHHPSLRLHALKGKLSGLNSVSINMSYRITLELLLTDTAIVLVNVGDHDSVY